MPENLTLAPPATLSDLSTREYILIEGARVNNLKSLSVAIPRGKLTVVTGVSGSGKSSLAFDTLFAEGQRQYVESLSSYARQFLGRMEKPDVDAIRGISPAVAIEQKVTSRNPRSTVGTATEIYDYLKLLFARIGVTISPVSGQPVRKDTVEDVLSDIDKLGDDMRLYVLAPLLLQDGRTLKQELEVLQQKGFNRLLVDEQTIELQDVLDSDQTKALDGKDLYILIDRAVAQKDDEATRFRLGDSVQTAFFEGHGACLIEVLGGERKTYSDRFEADGLVFEEPTPAFFSFNNPYGACKHCEGFGEVLGIDPNLVFPQPSLSVYEGAIAPWKGEVMGEWAKALIENGIHFDFPIHRPFNELSEKEVELLWTGNQYFKGLHAFFKHLESQTHKIQYRVMLARYRGRTTCPECKGTRIRKDAGYVKVGGEAIQDLLRLPVDKLSDFFDQLTLSDHQEKVAGRLLQEIRSRLGYLLEVGLSYLTLTRQMSTLSGGESQRIRLSTSLGSALVGSMYILDEPSIGLHPRDTQRLIGVLKRLRDLGNTVIVVEHEEEIMRAADCLIDIGPGAGHLGGELVYIGRLDEIGPDTPGLTAAYLCGEESIPLPNVRRRASGRVRLEGASMHNLKNASIEIPLGCLSVVTGVSGSGKSTLIRQCLFPLLQRHLNQLGPGEAKQGQLSGDLSAIEALEFIDQNPIGKSSRSNPVTYVKAYDAIRQLFADQAVAKQRGYTAKQFSFNVEGGRCETCQGEGVVHVEMQFMADIELECEECKGKRFKEETLEITYNDKTISDVLALTVDQAVEFFASEPKVVDKLLPLQQVGLGYVQLGQSSTTLSGGEAQRVKLATFLQKGGNEARTLFLFDEPTTGLHVHDIRQLLDSLQRLVERGHTVVIIEHNGEVIKCADWVVDLGPEGGAQGGNVLFQGTPEGLTKVEGSYTGGFLKGRV